MNSDRYANLNELEKDVLREISNIGAGNAATALAELLSNRVSISVPDLQLIDLRDIHSIVGAADKEVIGVLVTFSGDLNGILMYIMELDFGDRLLELLGFPSEKAENEALSELDLSVFKEIGNIVAGSYINAMADLTDLSIFVSPPDLAIDMVGALLNYPVSIFGLLSDKLLFVQEDFKSQSEQVSCHLLIMPDPQSLDRLMDILGVSDGN